MSVMRGGRQREHRTSNGIRIAGLSTALIAVIAYGAIGNPGDGPSVPRTALAANVASANLTLSATALHAVGLTYVGTLDVAQPSGTVPVLRFALTSGSLTGMSLTPACSSGTTTVTTADSAALTNATFDALRLTVSLAGTPLTFTVADPPTTAFPAEVTLGDVTLDATSLAADSLHMPSVATHAAGC